MNSRILGAAALAVLLTACGSDGDAAAEADEMAAPSPSQSAIDAAEAAAKGPFAPQDECAVLDGFDLFRSQLRRAVVFHDAKALAGIVDPNVKLDFGGGSGAAELMEHLANDERLWEELNAAISFGCASDPPDAASMPWIFTRAPEGIDGFTTYYVVGNDVPLRKSADAESSELRVLSHDLVQRIGQISAVEPDFINVRTMGDDPIEGYMAETRLRSLVDYRVIANRGGDGWKITAFVAGD